MGILWYVRRTSGFGTTFQRGTAGGLSLQAFADADYASVAADRRSVSGGLVMGACMSWFSRTKKRVTLNTTEAECVALADVMKEVLFLGQVWRFMLPAAGMPCIPVFEDNEGAVKLAQNHINISNTPITSTCGTTSSGSWTVRRKEVSIIHVPSQFQHANHFTNAIARDVYRCGRITGHLNLHRVVGCTLSGSSIVVIGVSCELLRS